MSGPSHKSYESLTKPDEIVGKISVNSNEKLISPIATTMSNTRTPFISLTHDGQFTVEHYLAEKMHKSRY